MSILYVNVIRYNPRIYGKQFPCQTLGFSAYLTRKVEKDVGKSQMGFKGREIGLGAVWGVDPWFGMDRGLLRLVGDRQKRSVVVLGVTSVLGVSSEAICCVFGPVF